MHEQQAQFSWVQIIWIWKSTKLNLPQIFFCEAVKQNVW